MYHYFLDIQYMKREKKNSIGLPINKELIIFLFVIILGDPEVTANIYCISHNLPNTDTQNYSTDLQ